MADDGYIDTNVFIHAFKTDDHSTECIAFLEGVRAGVTMAIVHPLVVHELTYIFKRHGVFPDKRATAEYIRSVLRWPGIVADVSLLDRALDRWGGEPQLSYVDAYLIEAALAEDRRVYTINVRDFAPFGVVTPSPLPSKGASGE